MVIQSDARKYKWILTAKVLLIFLCFNVLSAHADTDIISKDNKNISFSGSAGAGSFDTYIHKYADIQDKAEDIELDAGTAEVTGNIKFGNHSGRENVLLWESGEGSIEWDVETETESIYYIELDYSNVVTSPSKAEISLYINDEIPFDEADQIILDKVWKDQGDATRDPRDNDIRPVKRETAYWLKSMLKDSNGRRNDPLKFYLPQGKNKIKISSNRSGIAVSGIKLVGIRQNISYEEYLKLSSSKNNIKNEQNIHLEAEKPYLTSESVLYGMYDRTSAATSPSHPVKLRINTIGQNNWRLPGQWISWNFEVPEDGWYNLCMRVRQNYKQGFFSSRKIYINDKILFKEMESVKFPYNGSWYIKTLGDEEPYKIYLEKGQHTIKMEVVPGELADTMRKLEETVYDLNSIYREIIMITGVTPDPFRDYLLDQEIPGLVENMKRIAADLQEYTNDLQAKGMRSGSESAILKRLAYQLESFVEKPDTIPARLNDYNKNVISLSAWVLSLKEQPLELDYIRLIPPGQETPKANAGFLKQFTYKVRAFIGSFTEDYTMIGNVYSEKKALNVWVGAVRDQTQVIKELVDNEFVRKYNIPVNISLMQQGLIEATLAGKGPDIALIVEPTIPVNLAARGALIELSQFKGFDEVSQRFIGESIVPYRYKNGYYGLPLTQNFYMMFYRSDIFKELGILPPKTWDEFYKVVPVIQRNNMQVGMPSLPPNLSGIFENSIFEMLLFQRGGQYYKDGMTETGFDSQESLEAFRQWTDLYTKYRFPLSYDFYNRFRTGEIPLGIQDYSMYNLLKVAAPEIRNVWDMVPVPGATGKNGEVKNLTVGRGTAAIMLKGIDNAEDGWTFLNWFTSNEIQAAFGNSVETIIGRAGRYVPANTEVFRMLPWNSTEAEKLIEQMKTLKCIPNIPASYYTNRNISNAFRAVVLKRENTRETLYQYNKEINKEIERKNKEFGLH